MKFIEAIKIAWRYWRSNPSSTSMTWGLGNNVVLINPEFCGDHGDWSLGNDFDGQLIIYTGKDVKTS